MIGSRAQHSLRYIYFILHVTCFGTQSMCSLLNLSFLWTKLVLIFGAAGRLFEVQSNFHECGILLAQYHQECNWLGHGASSNTVYTVFKSLHSFIDMIFKYAHHHSFQSSCHKYFLISLSPATESLITLYMFWCFGIQHHVICRVITNMSENILLQSWC